MAFDYADDVEEINRSDVHRVPDQQHLRGEYDRDLFGDNSTNVYDFDS